MGLALRCRHAPEIALALSKLPAELCDYHKCSKRYVRDTGVTEEGGTDCQGRAKTREVSLEAVMLTRALKAVQELAGSREKGHSGWRVQHGKRQETELGIRGSAELSVSRAESGPSQSPALRGGPVASSLAWWCWMCTLGPWRSAWCSAGVPGAAQSSPGPTGTHSASPFSGLALSMLDLHQALNF